MDVRHEIRRLFSQSVVPAVCFMAVAYFTYHMVQGDRGLIAMGRLEKQISEAELALAKSDAQRQKLAMQVALLRPDSLDLDILDEQARQILGRVELDQMVIYYDSQKKADGQFDPTLKKFRIIRPAEKPVKKKDPASEEN